MTAAGWPPGFRPAPSSLPWSLTRDDVARPEAGRPYLASRVTRRGRFRKLDPSEPGRLWSRWRWLGLAFWVAVVVGSLARARSRVA